MDLERDRACEGRYDFLPHRIWRSARGIELRDVSAQAGGVREDGSQVDYDPRYKVLWDSSLGAQGALVKPPIRLVARIGEEGGAVASSQGPAWGVPWAMPPYGGVPMAWAAPPYLASAGAFLAHGAAAEGADPPGRVSDGLRVAGGPMGGVAVGNGGTDRGVMGPGGKGLEAQRSQRAVSPRPTSPAFAARARRSGKHGKWGEGSERRAERTPSEKTVPRPPTPGR